MFLRHQRTLKTFDEKKKKSFNCLTMSLNHSACFISDKSLSALNVNQQFPSQNC